MLYTNYKQSRNAAWEFLIKYKVKELPVRISAICEKEGIKLYSYEHAKDLIMRFGLMHRTVGNDGFTWQGMIFYNQECAAARQRFTVAHELGHIVLGHTELRALVNREPAANDNPVEQAANIFAARLLAPAIVLRDLGVTNAEEIQRLCDISAQAAQYRMQRLQLLYDREQRFLAERGYSCFGLSPLEREVERQFAHYIKHNKL